TTSSSPSCRSCSTRTCWPISRASPTIRPRSLLPSPSRSRRLLRRLLLLLLPPRLFLVLLLLLLLPPPPLLLRRRPRSRLLLRRLWAPRGSGPQHPTLLGRMSTLLPSPC